MPWDFSDALKKDAQLSRAVAEMNRPMMEAEKIIREEIAANFASESEAGTKWAPLAPRTVEDRIRKGYGGEHPILERTGELKSGMKGSSDNESAEVGPSEDIPYAGVQNDGSKDGKIPARPYLRISAKGEERISDAILDWLSENEG